MDAIRTANSAAGTTAGSDTPAIIRMRFGYASRTSIAAAPSPSAILSAARMTRLVRNELRSPM